MKRLTKVLGVTLLEIMLVLAIAALIIIMSVRYFQSASVSQQAVAFQSQLQAIAAAENNISQGQGIYGATSSISGIIPSGAFVPPWGGSTLTVGGGTGSFTVKASSSVPTGVCSLILGQMIKGGNWSGTKDCATLTYTLNPTSS